MMEIDPTASIIGPHGRVRYCRMPPVTRGMSKKAIAALDTTRGTWLIDSPGWHPLWNQYVLSVVSLQDHPDFPPAELSFAEATHEMIVFAISPDHPLTIRKLKECCKKGDLPFMQPINIAEQFAATDDEMRKLAWLAARAVVYGRLNPEPSDSPSLIRNQWLISCIKTLEHIRGAKDHESPQEGT